MGILARSAERLRLKNRLARFKKDPSPLSLFELVQTCLRAGEPDQAYQYSSWGMEEYPDSELIRELHRTTTKAYARSGLEAARREIQEKPSEDAYLKMARFAIQVRDGSGAQRALDECVKRFPSCCPARLTLAKLHERKFLRDLRAADGRRVIHELSKAARLSPKDVEPSLRLAHFFLRIGALREAVSVAREIIGRDPRNDVARKITFLGRSSERNQEPPVLLARIEEDGKLPGDEDDSTRTRRERDRLRRGLVELGAEIRADDAIVVDADGEAWTRDGHVEAGPFVELSAALSRTSNSAVRRADLGPLRAVTLETATGAVVLRRGARNTVSCLLASGHSIRGTQEALTEFLKKRPPSDRRLVERSPQ